MKVYRDVFGNPLPQSDVAAAARLVARTSGVTTLSLAGHFKWGYGKAARVMDLLEEASVISPIHKAGRTVILKNQDSAVNAALRQLRKGKVA